MSVFTDAGSVKIPGPPAPVTNGTFNEHTFKTSGNDVNYTYNPNVIPPGGSDVSRPALPGGSTSTQKFQFPSQDALIANEAADSLNYSWAGYFGAYRGDSPQEMTDALISTYQNDMGGATTAVRQKFLAGISEFTARLHNNGINVTHPPLGGLIGEGVGQPGVNVMAGIPQTDTSKGPKVFYSPSSGKASGTANEPLITSGEWAGHTETDKANFIKNNGGDVTAPSEDPSVLQQVKDNASMWVYGQFVSEDQNIGPAKLEPAFSLESAATVNDVRNTFINFLQSRSDQEAVVALKDWDKSAEALGAKFDHTFPAFAGGEPGLNVLAGLPTTDAPTPEALKIWNDELARQKAEKHGKKIVDNNPLASGGPLPIAADTTSSAPPNICSPSSKPKEVTVLSMS